MQHKGLMAGIGQKLTFLSENKESNKQGKAKQTTLWSSSESVGGDNWSPDSDVWNTIANTGLFWEIVASQIQQAAAAEILETKAHVLIFLGEYF